MTPLTLPRLGYRSPLLGCDFLQLFRLGCKISHGFIADRIHHILCLKWAKLVSRPMDSESKIWPVCVCVCVFLPSFGKGNKGLNLQPSMAFFWLHRNPWKFPTFWGSLRLISGNHIIHGRPKCVRICNALAWLVRDPHSMYFKNPY